MPQDLSERSKTLKKRAKDRYPNITSKQIRLFIHAWSNTLQETGNENIALKSAWDKLKQNMKEKRKKKAEIISYLVKLANSLDRDNLPEEADRIDFLVQQITKS